MATSPADDPDAPSSGEAGTPPAPKAAFKCAACGNLEDAGAAGERILPAACRICGAGVRFDPTTGVKTYDDDNWIVLAELPKAELKPILEFHGIKAGDIERHEPWPAPETTREPASIERSAGEAIESKDVTA